MCTKIIKYATKACNKIFCKSISKWFSYKNNKFDCFIDFKSSLFQTHNFYEKIDKKVKISPNQLTMGKVLLWVEIGTEIQILNELFKVEKILKGILD